jgi:xanthine/CO dehydrogenase XdhC/CoxF family maturation factor
MSELRFILQTAARLRASAEPFLVATVMRVRGSSYRRPGARMLLTQDRWVAGSVSGGCLEGDVIKKGWWHTRQGQPVLLTYDSTAQDEVRWGFGLGCDGVIDVLLERADSPGRLDPLAFLASCQKEQQRGVLATVFASEVPGVPIGARLSLRGTTVEADELLPELRERMLSDARLVREAGESSVRTYAHDGGAVTVLLEAVLPPARLFVLGAGHDAVAVVQIAHTLGWEVVVWEPHGRFATRERFALADEILFSPPAQLGARINCSERALALVMGHNYEQDRDALQLLLGTRALYIGMLGPQRRTARMLGELGGGPALADARIHAPVGLALGAESPQEIALSIIAEIQSVLGRASAASLRERRGPIHSGQVVAAVAGAG